MCVVHAFMLRHQGDEGERDPGMVAVVAEWAAVVVGVAQGGHLTQMTAVMSVEREVITPTTAPEGVVVEGVGAVGAGMFTCV